ncbi:ribosome-inactivating protein gelonin-like [Humulus lupulus]|uniref:ribosome-inactivating protein gelonin-like n=1 Tax=Humulus lupulus TaxID=3486 RepID=UPI002B40A34A|nr:ribosome-inactivating protein gelonin-like [Humulus lupulus]
MVQIVVATWLCIWSSSSIIAFGLGLGINYSNVSFNTEYSENITEQRYESFIKSLREKLKSETENNRSRGIPVLRTASEAIGNKKFVYATLHNDAGVSITFALNAVDAYVVAYQVNGGQNRCNFFKEFPADSEALVFHKCLKTGAGLPSSYGELGSREKTQLGFVPLSLCLNSFENFDGTGNTKDVRKCLLVVIQMVAEAARFKYIQGKMVAEGLFPGEDITLLENAWSLLSTAIQNSKDGTFSPIQLRDEKYVLQSVTMVDEVKDRMGLLLALKTPLEKPSKNPSKNPLEKPSKNPSKNPLEKPSKKLPKDEF